VGVVQTLCREVLWGLNFFDRDEDKISED
jgi:hypothetical protein